jgi:hypothetical protein
MKRYRIDINSDFKCLHCGGYVSAAKMLAGVDNRNHCPFCLWSRHLDLVEAGDRLAACKAPMRPIGLTLKRSRNKYAGIAGGELMLVHQCTNCERISINRIAADDIPEVILEVFAASQVELIRLQERILADGINLLDGDGFDIVQRQLFGQNNGRVFSAVPRL